MSALDGARSRWILLTLFILGPLAIAGGQGPTAGSSGSSLHLDTFFVTPVISTLDPDGGHLLVDLDIEGELWTLSLQRHSVRAPGFQLRVDDGGPSLLSVPPPAVSTWRGGVLQWPDADVRARWKDGKLWAVLRRSSTIWGIQPVSSAGIPGGPEDHVVYEASDLTPWRLPCALASGGSPSPTASWLGTGLHITEIAIDVDFEFFQAQGSLDATVEDVEMILNAIDLAFQTAPVSIIHEITTIVVRTAEPDPYTASAVDLLLEQFRATWNTPPETEIPRDLAHFLTGRNLAGTALGTGDQDAVCDPFDHYSLAESTFTANVLLRTALSAHFLGHAWSATHCDGAAGGCRIMCGALGGCDGLDPFEFGAAAGAEIAAFRDSVTCLADLALPLAVPVVETWSTLDLDEDRWIHAPGVEITDQALAEPSPPFSLVLDATGSADFADDEIRSNFVELASSTSPELSFATQHRGVEAGEELVVEFLAPDLSWVELERFTSTGIDQDVFDLQLIPLPDLARHDQFRLRFRVEVDEPDDDWFIDDVMILDGPPPVSFIRGDASFDGDFSGLPDGIFVLAWIFAGGLEPPCLDAADADDSGTINALVDSLFIFHFQFSGGAPPPPPFPDPGIDVTPDALGCDP